MTADPVYLVYPDPDRPSARASGIILLQPWCDYNWTPVGYECELVKRDGVKWKRTGSKRIIETTRLAGVAPIGEVR